MEDSPGDARLVQELLRKSPNLQVRVDVATRLADAIACLERLDVDVILSDLGLPDSQGIETVARLLEASSETPVVVLTGLAEIDNAKAALHHGAQDYLPKAKLTSELLERTLRYAIERQQARTELRKSEDRFHAIFESSPLAVAIALPGGEGPLHANWAFKALLGYTDAELAGLSIAKLTHADDLESDRAGIEAVMRGDQEAFTREKRLIHKDGSTVWVEAVVKILRDVGGVPEQILVVQRNISDRKRVESELERERERLFAVLDSLPMFVYLQGSDHKIRFANKTFHDLFGETEIRPCYEVFHGYDEPCPTCPPMRVQQTGVPEYSEWTSPAGRTYAIYDQVFPGSSDAPLTLEVGLDITDQKQAEREAAAEREHLFAVFETLPAFVYLQAPDHSIPFANRRFIELFGDPHGRPCHEILLGKDSPCEVCHTLMVLDAGEPVVRDWSSANGRTYVLHEHLFPVKGQDDLVLVIGLDITERHEAERQLRESEATQRSIVRASPVGIGFIREGKISWASERICEMLGYAEEDLIGQSPRLVTDTEESFRDVQDAMIRELREHGSGRAETRWQRKDGRILDIDLRFARVDASRPDRGGIFTAQDITEQKVAEAALQQSEENYRTIFDSANDVIMVHDPDTGRLLDVSLKVEEMFGHTRDEILALTVEEFSAGTHPYTQQEALGLIHAASGGEPQVFEWRTRRKDGTLFWTEVNLREVMLLGKHVVLALVRDISDRKDLEASLRQSQKLEAVGTLASGIAHEINNPLMGMINYADLIGSRADSEELRRFADEIKTEGDRIAKIVSNLLSFSRQAPESRSPARIGDIVEASLLLVGSLVKKDHISLEKHVSLDLPTVSCRSEQIQQVITNLILNARDSLNARYPGFDKAKRLRLEAGTRRDEAGDWVRLTVEDHGLGMSRALMERVFDPFYTTKPRDKGTGLGLSISYGIMLEHQGHLSVESEEGAFSRFHIDLPVARRD